jgi:hypothetical protein
MDILSDIPIWRVLAVIVTIAAVCPAGSASRTDIGCLNSASRYASRIAAETRMLTVRKPNYVGQIFILALK